MTAFAAFMLTLSEGQATMYTLEVFCPPIDDRFSDIKIPGFKFDLVDSTAEDRDCMDALEFKKGDPFTKNSCSNSDNGEGGLNGKITAIYNQGDYRGVTLSCSWFMDIKTNPKLPKVLSLNCSTTDQLYAGCKPKVIEEE